MAPGLFYAPDRAPTSQLGHVWTAPCKNFLTACSIGRVRSRVRPPAAAAHEMRLDGANAARPPRPVSRWCGIFHIGNNSSQLARLPPLPVAGGYPAGSGKTARDAGLGCATRDAQMVDRKPTYHFLKRISGTDKRLCDGPVRLSVIACSSTALCRSNWMVEAKMLSKAYLDTARSILRAAQTMTDQRVAGQLKALAENYERRAEKAARADAAKALARSAACEYEGALS
jgi:hypothetical protein